ncbi:MAG: hypothetical protein ABFD79_01655 [Phycisphaerales bacterium]
MNHILDELGIFMIKKIISKLVILIIGVIKSYLVGSLVALLLSGNIDIAPLGFVAAIFILPAVFFYYISYILDFKKYICMIFYFAGFILVELLFGINIIVLCMKPMNDGSLGLNVFFFYVIIFIGIAVYFAQIIFRDQTWLKKLGYKEQINKINWKVISLPFHTQMKMIFTDSARSYFITSVIICITILVQSFVVFHIKDFVFMFYGLLFSFGLFPAIIIYQIFRYMRLRKSVSDISYFLTIILIELSLILFIFSQYANSIGFSYENEQSRLPRFGMSVIALGGFVFYISEVYFRNRAIVKSLEQNSSSFEALK